MIDGLNDFSARFAAAILDAIPSLEPFASLDTSPKVAVGSLLIRCAPNAAAADRIFWVSTDNGEVTVGFDQYHVHCEWPDADEDPIKFVQDLVSERTLIQVTMRGEKWVSSRAVETDRGELPDAPRQGHTVYIYSWSGAGDRVLRG